MYHNFSFLQLFSVDRFLKKARFWGFGQKKGHQLKLVWLPQLMAPVENPKGGNPSVLLFIYHNSPKKSISSQPERG